MWASVFHSSGHGFASPGMKMHWEPSQQMAWKLIVLQQSGVEQQFLYLLCFQRVVGFWCEQFILNLNLIGCVLLWINRESRTVYSRRESIL